MLDLPFPVYQQLLEEISLPRHSSPMALPRQPSVEQTLKSDTARWLPTQCLLAGRASAGPRGEARIASNQSLRFAVTLLTFIGETVLALPSLIALRQAFPSAAITAITLKSNADLIRGHPVVDGVRICNLRSCDVDSLFQVSSYVCLAGLIRWLRLQSFDIGVELTPATKWLFRLAGVATIAEYPLDGVSIIRAKREVSPRAPHAVDRYLSIVEQLGAYPIDGPIQLVVDSRARQFADGLLSAASARRHKLLVGVHFGASARVKQWNPTRFAQLCNAITAEYEAQMLFFGGTREIALATQTATQMPKPPVVATGITSLKQTCALIERCHLFISNDSGPLHLAAALRVPLVGSTARQTTGSGVHRQTLA